MVKIIEHKRQSRSLFHKQKAVPKINANRDEESREVC